MSSVSPQQFWYFTAPWEPISIRRGDALGFRAGADYFADLLAPGLSNAVSDARWISLLSWCLKWSHVVWEKAGNGDLSSRDGQRARYAWLRPLELLWVDRTLESGQTTGELRGRRSIERWRRGKRHQPNFAMSPEQFRQFRQIGTYGSYRVAFRLLPGLTTGDGWTPADTALRLADVVNESLPPDVRLRHQQFEGATRWRSWADDEARYWVRRGWPTALVKPHRGFLPTPVDAVRLRLPEEERRLLKPAVFGIGSARLSTAEVLADCKGASSHAELCELLATSKVLRTKLTPQALGPLPAFTRFADAAMHAMRGLWSQINHDGQAQAPTIAMLAKSDELRSRLETVRRAGTEWLAAEAKGAFPHNEVPSQLAKAMKAAVKPTDQIRSLARHHYEYGGGRRWFREEAGRLVPAIADTGINASDYRFRLRSLSRLAAQCGVATMTGALRAVEKSVFDDETRPASDDENGDVL